LQRARFAGPLGPRDGPLPAIGAPGPTAIYFVDQALAPDRLFEIDFVLDENASGAGLLRRVDHVAFGLPQGELDTWILFCRAVLGMEAGASLELADPFGLIRSAGIATPDRALRFVLNVSLGQKTRTARTVSVTGGSATVHHVGLSVDDAIAGAEALRARGTPLVPISPNYYDDLAARLDLDAATLARMRDASVLYDRTADGGEYRHAYTASFADRFFFEIVERRDDYDAYGALNAPARMVSDAQQARGGK
jgi:4-hydroxyphenylpyruvate dioxygenase